MAYNPAMSKPNRVKQPSGEKYHSRQKHKVRGNWTDPDNRDIFDKALDYAPLVGAALGARYGFKRKLPKGLTAEDGSEVVRAYNSAGGGAAGFMGGLFTKAALSSDYGYGEGKRKRKR